jgi:hypothetical protein
MEMHGPDWLHLTNNERRARSVRLSMVVALLAFDLLQEDERLRLDAGQADGRRQKLRPSVHFCGERTAGELPAADGRALEGAKRAFSDLISGRALRLR